MDARLIFFRRLINLVFVFVLTSQRENMIVGSVEKENKRRGEEGAGEEEEAGGF